MIAITLSDSAPTFVPDFANDMGPFVEVSITGHQSGAGPLQVQGQLNIDLMVRNDA